MATAPTRWRRAGEAYDLLPIPVAEYPYFAKRTDVRTQCGVVCLLGQSGKFEVTWIGACTFAIKGIKCHGFACRSYVLVRGRPEHEIIVLNRTSRFELLCLLKISVRNQTNGLPIAIDSSIMTIASTWWPRLDAVSNWDTCSAV